MRRLLPKSAAFVVLLAGSAQTNADIRQRSPNAAAIHSTILALDDHADVLYPAESERRYAGPDGRSQTEFSKLRSGGVGAIVLEVAAGTGPPTPEGVAAARKLAEEKLAIIIASVKEHSSEASIAYNAGDVSRIHRSGRVAVLIGFQNPYSLGNDLNQIDMFVNRGVRVFDLAHAGNNAYADSSRPMGQPAVLHHGLSSLGRSAVERLNQLGVLIDVSQLTPDGVRQVVALSRTPVIASHSDARALIDNSRNLSDEELALIARTGGVVGATPFSPYVSHLTPDYTAQLQKVRRNFGLPPAFTSPIDDLFTIEEPKRSAYVDQALALGHWATLKDFVDHIDYLVKRMGVDHVSIGSDFNHGGGVKGFLSEADAPNVTAELVRRGYSRADIAKIWSGNFLRVLTAAERGASNNAGHARPASTKR